MIRILILFVVVIFFSDCTALRTLRIKSAYPGNADSVVVKINFKNVSKIENVKFGLDTTITYPSDKFTSGHDVIISVALHNNGHIVDSFFTFNDLNYVPDRIEVSITDSLRLRCNVISR